MDNHFEHSLPAERRNALEAFTASCFRRRPSLSNYTPTDLTMAVQGLALWVALQPDAALDDDTVFSASTIDLAVRAGFLEWSPKPRRDVRTMLERYGETLSAASFASQ